MLLYLSKMLKLLLKSLGARRMFNTKVLADGWTCAFVFLNSLVYVARCVTYITCIAQVTLQTRHCWLTRGGLASRILRSRSIFWPTNTRDTVVWTVWLKFWTWRRTMSAEDWSLNCKITRIGSDESETAAGDETGWSEMFVAIKREIVELLSLPGYLNRKKAIYDDRILRRNTSSWTKVRKHDQT